MNEEIIRKVFARILSGKHPAHAAYALHEVLMVPAVGKAKATRSDAKITMGLGNSYFTMWARNLTEATTIALFVADCLRAGYNQAAIDAQAEAQTESASP